MAEMASAEMMQEIRDLAERCPGHRLAPDMVNGSRPLTREAAGKVIARLEGIRGAGQRETPVQAVLAAASQRTDFPPPLAWFKGKIPPGYYATPNRTGTNDFDFWFLEEGSGKWNGQLFVRRVLGGGYGAEIRSEQLPNMQQRLAAQAILGFGAEAARMKFVELIGRCTRCGRMLTDDDSRAAGMGQICRAK